MRTTLALVVIFGIGVLCGQSAVAQDVNKSDPTPAPQKANPEAAKWAREQWDAQQDSMRRGQLRSLAEANPLKKPVTIDFLGGSINQYIEAVQAAAGERRVISFVSDDVKVPKTKLENVSMISALLMLERCDASPVGPNAIVVLDREDDAVYVRTVNRGAPVFLEETRVWSIRSIIDAEGGVRAEDVLAAMQAALALRAESIQVSFHAETGLVMAMGRSDQMSVINAVISTLQEDARARAALKRAAEERLDSEIQRLKGAQLELEKRLAETVEKLSQETVLRRSLEEKLALRAIGR